MWEAVTLARIVVGGKSHGVGKTTVVCALLAALPDLCWTAVKVTQCHHDAPDCHCLLGGRTFAIREENDAGQATDTSRYLAAGARRALWLRVRPGDMPQAMVALQKALEGTPDTIIESNRAEWFDADLVLAVSSRPDSPAKPSWHALRERADALIYASSPEKVEMPQFALGELHELTGWVSRFLGDLA